MATPDVAGIPVTLSCGLTKDGKTYTDAIVVSMTGAVRKAIARPEVRQNPAKVIDTLLLSCVQSIGPVSPVTKPDIDKLLLGDRDDLTIAIRRASMGNVVTASMTCDSCKEKLDLNIDLSTLKVKKLSDTSYKMDGDIAVFDVNLPEHGIQATFRFPNGEDQSVISPLLRRNPIEANYRLYFRCIREWNGKSQKELLPTLFDDIRVDALDALGYAFMEAQPGPELREPTSCPMCGAEIIASMESSDFLFPLPKREKI